ncbi:winged helix-turn-helix domain-containing protein [Escherichia albertii]|uniref:winged helix-turn-helix domain-containing protein n=1 Tax=Escherichia albertii TaxID=208962 RepID=UPI0011F34F65|nr:transcriptional regulator [Escherichia albertii]MCZ9164898.1 transcriptional regulator [Escherichia albertii]
MYWIINDNIEFWPEKKRLISVHNTDLTIVLTTPASRCLTLLLEAFPDVVTQQDFFKKVWEEAGMHVPTNTLYQNISIIRRGLRAVGETSGSLVATVPRKGFKIENTVNVERQSIITTSDSPENNTPALQPTISYKEETIVRKKFFTKEIRKCHRTFLSMLSAFITGLLFAFLVWQHNQPKPFFADYKSIAEIKGCNFNVTEDSLHGMKDYDKYTSLILTSGIDCKKYPWLYFSLSRAAPGLIVMACKKNYNTHEVAGCVTLSFREVNHA